jgi:hypothetical protein
VGRVGRLLFKHSTKLQLSKNYNKIEIDHSKSNQPKCMRRGKREMVLPPMRTLQAYPTQKSFVSLDG